jgi:DNA repair exonuclease SbcCD ATPase subunit
MITLKIKRIEIQGFRAFGKSVQALDFNSLIACVLGPNSQGKTSLAEAFEFLLTGQIVRRVLLASTQDEFADALRNVHMPKSLPTFVQATLVADNKTYVVKRTLIADYSKKQDCQSVLHIGGMVATEADLVTLAACLTERLKIFRFTAGFVGLAGFHRVESSNGI